MVAECLMMISVVIFGTGVYILRRVLKKHPIGNLKFICTGQERSIFVKE